MHTAVSLLQLRPVTLADSHVIYHTLWRHRTYFQEWLPFVTASYTEVDARIFIERQLQQQIPIFALEYEGEFCGVIQCKNIDYEYKKTELGYWLALEYQKKGLMRAALTRFISYLFESMEIHRIVIKCALTNRSSQQLAIHLGFHQEGVEREGEYVGQGGYRDLQVYSLLTTDFNQPTPSKQVKPGIHHLELWVSDWNVSRHFYQAILELIGWREIQPGNFVISGTEIYLKEKQGIQLVPTYGVRHLCLQASTQAQVDAVGVYLQEHGFRIIRGPVFMTYSEDYYTVDFYSPDGFIIEVVHTTNLLS